MRSSAKKCASGSTISATAAIETPANPAVTYCCPQDSAMNGSAVESAPTVTISDHEARSGPV